MNTLPIRPSQGAAQVVVLKNVVGMMFWICGVPGRASIVKRECAESDRAGNEPLGNVALAEHLGRERINGEHHHEQRYAAIGKDRADHDDRQHRPLPANQADDRGDDRLGEPRQLDDLAEHRSEHEHRKIVFHKADHLLHEHAGKHRRDQ